jgi:hypothetical protein
LSKGLNFAVTPAVFPRHGIISGVECAIRRLEPESKSVIRQRVSRLLRSARRPKPNISENERAALASLRSNEEIIILPADKGNMVVVMDRQDYQSKMKTLVECGPYRVVRKDPGKVYRKSLYDKLRGAHSSGRLSKQLLLRLCPTYFQTPHLFGLPKIHKPGIPLRPIVSQFSSLFSGVSRYLADVLKPFVADSDSFVLNSVDLKEKLLSDHCSGEGFFVSFDVESLFTSVPIDGALEAFRRVLSRESSLPSSCVFTVDELLDLAEFLLRHSYFEFDSRIFVQFEGVSMGSSLGPVAACLYMDFFENQTFSLAKSAGVPCPPFWVRYVDDVLARWPFSHEELDIFLNFLNSQADSISFTMELECDGKLPFLDLLIDRSRSQLTFSVFRKHTHTDLYLNRLSCHPAGVFKGLVRSLGLRAKRLCSADHLSSERVHLRNVLIRNGFSHRECLSLRAPSTVSKTFEPPVASIPYVPVVGEKIKKVLSDFSIPIALRPQKTLRSLLVKKRPSPALVLGSVYQLSCSESTCDFSYVGETGRPLEERKKEHLRAVRELDVHRSELAKHVHETDHRIAFDSMLCLDRESSWRRRITKEALWTQKLRSSNKTKTDVGRFYDCVL